MSQGKTTPVADLATRKPTRGRLRVRARRRFGWLACSVLFTSLASGQSLVDSPEIRAGELDAVAAAWWQAARAHPDSLETQYRLLLWERELDERPGESLRAQDWRELLDALAPESGWTARQVRRQLAEALRREGNFEEALGIGLGDGTPRSWMAIGPFGSTPSTALYRPYPPETEFDPEANYTAGGRDRRWREIRTQEGDTRVDPSEASSEADGVHYLRARFALATEFRGLLLVSGDTSLRAWVDGVEVCVRDRLRDPRTTAVTIGGLRCAPGEHTLLIKCEAHAPFSIAFRHEDGTAPQIEERSPRDRTESPFGTTLDRTLGPRGSVVHEWSARWREDRLAPELWLPLANLSVWIGDAYQAREVLLRWEEEDRPVVPLALVATEIASRLDYLPSDWVDNWVGGLWRRAAEEAPGTVPLRIAEARRNFAEDRTEEAAQILEEVLTAQPRSLPALLLLEEIAEDRGWRRERLTTLDRLAEVAPTHPETLRRWIRRWERDSRPDLALPFREALCAAQPDLGTVIALANAYRRSGRSQAAMTQLEHLDQLAGTPFDALRHRYSLLESWGELELAREFLTRLIALRPDDPGYHESAAELAWRTGDLKTALHHYRTSRSLRPGEIRVSLRIERLEQQLGILPESAPFWAPHALECDHVLQQAPARDRYPRAAAVYLLDQMVTWASATRGIEEMIHQIIRVDSAEAVERFSELEVPGEVLRLRVISAAGEELHPTSGDSGGTYTLPGLSPGAVIEYRCLNRRDLPRAREFQTGAFYFQDTDYAAAFHLSQWVAYLGPGLTPTIEERNLPFTHEARVHEDLRELVWTAREMDCPEAEPLAPPVDRILPNVRLAAPSDWSQALEDIEPQFALDDAPSPELERAVQGILAGISDEREQVAALFAACCERVTSEGDATNATQVWLTRSGDRDTLLAGLLRTAGIAYEEVRIARRDDLDPFRDWDQPNPHVFNYALIRVPSSTPGADPLVLSAQFRLAEPGRIPRPYQGGRAIVVSPTGGRWTTVPAGELSDEAQLTETRLVLGPGGRVSVEGSLEQRQLETTAVRDNLKDLPEAQRRLAIEGFVGRLFPGATDTRGGFPDLDAVGVPFRIEFQTHSSRLLQTTGDGPVLRTVFYPARLRTLYGSGAERKYPLVSTNEALFQERTTVELGEHYALARLPEGLELCGPWGNYWLHFEHSGTQLVMERRLELHPFVAQANEVSELQAACLQIDRKEEERVVLRQLPPHSR
ncbi:MAG: hypothetical protein AB7O52_09190 [Planctomycetota bacterium]